MLLKAGALQSAIFNSANFSSIATDAKGVIQIFNVGAERMLGYTAAEVMNKITPADISDPQEVVARAKALSVELGTPITPGFEALVFKAARGIEDIYELTYIRKGWEPLPGHRVRDGAARCAGRDHRLSAHRHGSHRAPHAGGIAGCTPRRTSATRCTRRAADFDEYLVKPVDLDLLRTWLRSRG